MELAIESKMLATWVIMDIEIIGIKVFRWNKSSYEFYAHF